MAKALTAATTHVAPKGPHIEMLFTFSDVDDGDTFTLAGRHISFQATAVSDPSTNTSAGVNVASAFTSDDTATKGGSTVFTFYPGVDNVGVNFMVITN